MGQTPSPCVWLTVPRRCSVNALFLFQEGNLVVASAGEPGDPWSQRSPSGRNGSSCTPLPVPLECLAVPVVGSGLGRLLEKQLMFFGDPLFPSPVLYGGLKHCLPD